MMCTCLWSTASAGNAPISRAQLKRAMKSQTTAGAMPVVAPGETVAAAVQRTALEREAARRNESGKLTSIAGSSVSELEGDKIIVADAYDFDWDDETGTAVIDYSSVETYGKKVYLHPYYHSQYIRGFFGWYFSGFRANEASLFGFADTFPIVVNTSNNTMRIEAGVVVASGTWTPDPSIALNQPHPRSLTDNDQGSVMRIIRSAYFMPESWLMGDDEYGDICGQICSDGSIIIREGFAVLFQDVITRYYEGQHYVDTIWGMSPIFHHMNLMVPNGKHEYSKGFQTSIVDHGGMGHGGLAPRPINPRPLNPKPVTPRPINNKVIGQMHSASPVTRLSLEPQACRGDIERFVKPVYMYQADSTTYVYNLYGSDYCWNYLNIGSNGSVDFPGQVINCLGESHEQFIYNCSLVNDTLAMGNNGEISQNGYISWDTTYPYDYNNDSTLNYTYSGNLLYYVTDHVPVVFNPRFAEPVVTATHVTFRAYSIMGHTVEMYSYDLENDDYCAVPNPWTVERADTAYFVCLEAFSVLEDSLFSDCEFFEYEVPALTKGDVNHDGEIDVCDVTALISYILGNQPEDFYIGQANMDGDEEGEIDVNDVTALIAYILDYSPPAEE